MGLSSNESILNIVNFIITEGCLILSTITILLVAITGNWPMGQKHYLIDWLPYLEANQLTPLLQPNSQDGEQVFH